MLWGPPLRSLVESEPKGQVVTVKSVAGKHVEENMNAPGPSVRICLTMTLTLSAPGRSDALETATATYPVMLNKITQKPM